MGKMRKVGEGGIQQRFVVSEDGEGIVSRGL